MTTIQKISAKNDKNQALGLIKTSWPEKDRGYLNFFLNANSDYCFAAKDKDADEVIGIILARKASKKDKVWMEISIVIVREGYRRRGIGSALIDALIEVCANEGVGCLFLNSGEEDVVNGSPFFYLKNDFKIVGCVKNPGETLLYFQKDL